MLRPSAQCSCSVLEGQVLEHVLKHCSSLIISNNLLQLRFLRNFRAFNLSNQMNGFLLTLRNMIAIFRHFNFIIIFKIIVHKNGLIFIFSESKVFDCNDRPKSA